MRGIWLSDQQFRYREDLPAPAGKPGEVRLRVSHAGICGTDLELQQGYNDFHGIPGHEFVATVDDPLHKWHGRRVVSSINVGCGRCEFCDAGVRAHCINRTVIGIRDHGGAFAEYVTAPTENLHAIPDSLDDLTAVLVEPVAACLEILEQLTPLPPVLVNGAGRMGQLVASVLQTHGFAVSLHVRNPERKLLPSLDCRIVDQVKPASYATVIDCTGSAAGVADSLSGLRARGTLVLKSSLSAGAALDLNRVMRDEITVVGSRCGPFDRAIEWLTRHPVGPAELSLFAFEDIHLAVEAARNPGHFKAILVPNLFA